MTEKKIKPLLWTRREAILKTSALLGGATLVGQALMLAGCGRYQKPANERTANRSAALFDNEEIYLLSEIADTILPETDTPGAKAAGVGAFIALMVTDTYSPEEQQVFRNGLAAIDDASQQAYGSRFTGLTSEQRLEIARRFDREQFDALQEAKSGPPHHFHMFKQLTVLGYFTSEVAYRDVLEYVETPGRYDGNRDLGPDVRMFAGHGSSIYNT